MERSGFSFLNMPFSWRRGMQILLSILYFLAIFAVYRAGYSSGLRDGAKIRAHTHATLTTTR